MDRALFTGGHEREGGGSHTRSRVLCVRNMWSVTHGGIVRAKSLRPRLRACARLLPCLPTHTHTNRTYMCAHDACLAFMYLLFFSSILFPRFHCLAPSFFLSLFPLSLYLSSWQRGKDCWPWPADHECRQLDSLR